MRQQGTNSQPWSPTSVLFLVLQCVYLVGLWELGEAVCVPSTGCDTAYAFYRVQANENLTTISQKFQTTAEKILAANPGIVDTNYVVIGSPLYIPFTCDCFNDQLLHNFQYVVQSSDSPYSIATFTYDNLTTESWVGTANSLPDVHFVITGTSNLNGIASNFNTSADLLRKFNPSVLWTDFQPTQYAFIPVTDRNGNYPRYIGDKSELRFWTPSFLTTSIALEHLLCEVIADDAGKSTNTGVIVGAAIGGTAILFILLALVLYFLCVLQPRNGRNLTSLIIPGSASTGSTRLSDYAIDSVANKIGEGGFAVVFYGVIRGQKLAIKRMNLQATKEFLAELQVLTHVHHTNLVQLIGYCTTDYLFLVYEFMENGTLDYHLHSAKAAEAPLSWSSRVQIALDAARGLEYLHEHTRPSYIHRDIKSANILLDKDARAKVADFGLTKLTETKIDGNLATISTRVVGTWGYLSPEYATFGEVSPMVDVFAFGVVLLELLSGREAILRGSLVEEVTPSGTALPKEDQTRSLVKYFDPVLKAPNGRDKLPKFMDPALGDNYTSDAAWKMAQLAGACTQDLPDKRPNIRKAVVALMAMSSATCEWEIGAFANHRATDTSGS
ncbi:hypothetical protein KC19_N018700 [Ceratodon purpureus]|nr:hypothetical protein KC19_N018700 [Ceratodon purpureus]